MLADPAYSVEGRLSAIARFNAALDQSFGYDTLGRLNTPAIGVTGQTGSAKVGWGYTRNAASQILTETRDNDLYAWLGRQNANIGYTANGLNQYAAVGTAAFCYDPDGNLVDDGTYVYRYDVENRLVEMRVRSLPAGSCPSYTTGYTGSLMASLHYDPLGRLSEALKYTAGALTKTTRFLYDGDALVLEYDGSNAILNRYVHGSNARADDPLLWYPGSGTADASARNLYADPRGSIVLVEGEDGTVAAINTYDEWGANAPGNLGRFQYTGQVWLDELGMFYYKARIYSPRLGRFMQTDPIGYQDQMDLYAYAEDDPVDGVDPSGQDKKYKDEPLKERLINQAVGVKEQTDGAMDAASAAADTPKNMAEDAAGKAIPDSIYQTDRERQGIAGDYKLYPDYPKLPESRKLLTLK